MGCLLTLAVALGALTDDPWCVLYDSAFQVDNVAAWTSPLTSSEKTPEGLRIGDPSTEGGSGRFYHADWQVHPQVGATVEARLKVVSCSAPWGVVLLVSDGVHEEGVTFFPHQVTLAWAGISVPFDTQDKFHTYRVHIEGTDIQVWADDKLLLDGTGKFTASAQGNRNQIGFGCGSSAATGEAVWPTHSSGCPPTSPTPLLNFGSGA